MSKGHRVSERLRNPDADIQRKSWDSNPHGASSKAHTIPPLPGGPQPYGSGFSAFQLLISPGLCSLATKSAAGGVDWEGGMRWSWECGGGKSVG